MLLRVHGVGVLLTGAAGAGKSTLALELVGRGHALVADDAVDLRRVGHRLVGRAPRLRGFLAVRQLGILDLRALYGPRAARITQQLDLVVRLTGRRTLNARTLLAGRRSQQRIFGLSVPTLSLGADVGHNLPTLVEAACLQLRKQK